MKIVIALGGNAILRKGESPSAESQFANTAAAMRYVAPLAKHQLAITHGNGPQVGNILLKDKSVPLHVAVAETQGEIGYFIEQGLANLIKKPVVSILTRVLVDEKDPAFKNPTKFIGPFYTREQADKLGKSFDIEEDPGRGYRRVVPSPKPVKIIEAGIIKKLINDNIVIAAGGGGIPVVMKNKKYEGVDAVIDKDLASACLAKNINAQLLIMLTGEHSVFLNYRRANETPIKKMNVKEALLYKKQGHFPPGSMGPKIDAAIDFVDRKGKKAIITSPENLGKAIKGKEGTVIER